MATTTDTRYERQAEARQQTAELLRKEISFIYSREFDDLAESVLENQAPEQILDDSTEVDSGDNESAAAGLRSPLLTPEGERYLFRRMNFLKFRANSLRSRLHPDRPRKSSLETIRRCLTGADEARTMIVQANLRLVASLAHKFANSRSEFEDLVSEGHVILVNAVDKFDYSRGFRFSTYATHSIQRHYFRLMHRRQRRKNREISTPAETLAEMAPERLQDAPLDHRVAETLIRHFEDCLDLRERMILEARFGLSSSGAGTLKAVAEHVGLSKERVRQLQIRAIEKLQDLALRLNLRLEQNV